LCRFAGIQAPWDTRSFYPSSGVIRPKDGSEGQDAVLSVLLQILDIPKCDAELRTFRALPRERAVAEFDRLRGEWMQRPEFRHFTVDLSGHSSGLADSFSALGFKVSGIKP
jgi:hypothetical protein